MAPSPVIHLDTSPFVQSCSHSQHTLSTTWFKCLFFFLFWAHFVEFCSDLLFTFSLSASHGLTVSIGGHGLGKRFDKCLAPNSTLFACRMAPYCFLTSYAIFYKHVVCVIDCWSLPLKTNVYHRRIVYILTHFEDSCSWVRDLVHPLWLFPLLIS